MPVVVELVAEKYDLVEVNREYRYDSEELRRLAFAREEDVPEEHQ